MPIYLVSVRQRAAAEQVDEVPEAKAWLRHIAQPHGLRHVDVADQRLFPDLDQHDTL